MTAPRSLRVVLGAFIAIGSVLAIFLSWGALHELALEVGGMPPERAAVFPIVVDLPAVAAMLIILFVSAPSRRLAALPWLTFGVAAQVGVGRSTVARWLSQPNTEVAA